MRFFSSRRPAVGLDVGSAFIRAVALRRTRHGWRLVTAGEAALGDDTNPDVRATVSRLLDDLGLHRANVSVAVPAHAAIVRRVSLSVTTLSDLDEHVALEVEQHTALAREETSLSYHLLSRGRPDDLDVLFAAARSSEVADRLSLVTGRRRVSVADVEGLALANAFVLNYPDQCESALLVHVGRRSTVICIVRQGEPVVTRGLSAGLPGPDADPAALVGDVLQACASHTPTSTPHGRSDRTDRVVVSGGGARSDALFEQLSHAFHAVVERFDPIRRIDATRARTGSPTMGPSFAVAVGLALRRRGDA